MGIFDWIILIVPIIFVMYMGFYSRRYIRGVADYLACGRVCGRYVLGLGDVANALSIIGIVAYAEMVYKTGFAVSFWSRIAVPLSVVITLSGYCTYRFRETKAMSLGQFLEMRYSRRFRIFAAALRSIAEMLANMIMPALAARFFIHILELPETINLFGLHIPMFSFLVVLFLTLAITLICLGGTLALVITDTIQGMFLYPILGFFVIFILCKFSWSDHILPVMMDRVAGESFLNPYDIEQLRDFNLFSFAILPVFVAIIHTASWTGAGTVCAAKSPHEQKMAAVLGGWRNTLVSIFTVLIAIAVITFMNHKDFAPNAQQVRAELAERVSTDVLSGAKNEAIRQAVAEKISGMPPTVHIIGEDTPLSQNDNLDTRFLEQLHDTLTEECTARAPQEEKAQIDAKGEANYLYQQMRTLYYQLSMAITMRNILPAGLFGLFCLLLFLAMLSTDDTRIYSAALTIAQDVVLPLKKKPFTPKQHVRMIQLVSIGVGVFFFFGSHMMAQLDYINMFVTLVCSLWMGGCGPVMIFGLYSRFGTTAGAWASLLAGIFLSLITIFTQRCWANIVYPTLEKLDLVNACDKFLRWVSDPFNPVIEWHMDAVKCPINTYEFYFMTMVVTLALYIIVSKLTCKVPFNLDRMLHRGKYSLDGARDLTRKWDIKSIWSTLIGITPEYTFGDKLIAWGVFAHNFIYSFIVMFIGVIVWNTVSPWPNEYWGIYFLINTLILPCVIAYITMLWFGIGGVIDLLRLFRDLKNRVANTLDDGRVEGTMSLADKAQLEALDAPAGEGTSKTEDP